MDESSILDAFTEPSIQHWLSLMLGQWIYALNGSEVPIVAPVTALMVLIAATGVIAMLTLALIIAFLGAKAIFSGGATASIVSGNSPFMPIRIIASLGLLMPTTYGITQLQEHNVTISNGQVGVVMMSLLGSGVADVEWLLAGKSLIKYNITANSLIRNTSTTSNTLAKNFVCNEFYHKRIGVGQGFNKFYYHRSRAYSADSSVELSYSLVGVDDFSSIPASDVDAEQSQSMTVYLGGRDAYCGKIRFTYLPKIAPSGSVISALREDMFAGVSASKAEIFNGAMNDLIVELQHFETYAERYHALFGQINANNLIETSTDRERSNKIDLMKTFNIGALPSTGAATLEDKVAAATDGLNYLMLRLAYFQKAQGTEASSAIMATLSGEEGGGNLNGFSETLFDRFFHGWVSAGSYWMVFQSLSELLTGVEVHLHEIGVDPIAADISVLCQKQNMFSAAVDTVTSWFSGDGYDCQTSKHVLTGFDLISKYALDKAQIGDNLPDAVAISGTSYPVDKSVWAGYTKAVPKTKEDMSFMTEMTMSLIESVWSTSNWLNSDETGALTGAGASTSRGLLTGSEPIMMDNSATTSPYVLLTRLGENTRDLALLVNFSKTFLKSVAETLVAGQSARMGAQATFTFGGSTLLTLPLEIPFRVFINGILEIVNAITMLYTALIGTSLIAMYGIPLIPVAGWNFIIMGILFTIVTATASINFAAILMGLPKGEGVFSPDTERILSLVFGVFVRQSLIVLGFVLSLSLGYVGLSVLNVTWVASFANKLGGSGIIDDVLAVFVFFIGYAVIAFYICLYSFRAIDMCVETIGTWFSTWITGGAFGSNGQDIAAAQNGLGALANSVDELKHSFEKQGGNNNGKEQSSKNEGANNPNTKSSSTRSTNA